MHYAGNLVEKSRAAVWVIRIFLLLGRCMTATNTAHSGPANPEAVRIAQPDGAMFQVFMRGDEFQGWMETDDGYAIIKNAATGFYEFVTQGLGGELIPSGIAVHLVDAAFRMQLTVQGVLPPKGLRPPRNTALERYRN